MTQIVTRVDEALATAVDRLVAEGVVASRSEAVRRGLEALIDRHERAMTGRTIANGYRRMPQTEAEIGWADDSTRRMITEEPW